MASVSAFWGARSRQQASSQTLVREDQPSVVHSPSLSSCSLCKPSLGVYADGPATRHPPAHNRQPQDLQLGVGGRRHQQKDGYLTLEVGHARHLQRRPAVSAFRRLARAQGRPSQHAWAGRGGGGR